MRRGALDLNEGKVAPTSGAEERRRSPNKKIWACTGKA